MVTTSQKNTVPSQNWLSIFRRIDWMLLATKKYFAGFPVASQQWILTWKCKMIVQISPSVSFGFPSVMSSGRMLTSFTDFFLKKLSAVSTFWSMWNRSLPFSRGWNRSVNKNVIDDCSMENIFHWLSYPYLQVSHWTTVQVELTNSGHLVNPEKGRSHYRRLCEDDCWSIS